MRKKWLVAAFIGALLGLVVSAISISEYVHIQKAGLEESSFCAINETINCDIINASSYATLFRIPTAAWGFLFYLLLACYAIFTKAVKNPKQRTVAFAWAISLVGLLWTIRMAYISAFVLKAFCITCLGQYVINLFLLIAFTFASEEKIVDRIKLLFSQKIITHGLTAMLVLGIGYVFAFSAFEKSKAVVTDADIRMMLDGHFRQSLNDIKPESLANAPTWGNPNAKTTIVEFSDFQCPFCRMAAFNIKPYLYEFRDKVKFVFLNYPLDNSCNKYLNGPMHQNACTAAKAAVCAKDKGKFWEYSEDLFRNQTKLSREEIVKLAQKNGMDKTWFEGCIDSEETLNRVKDDIETANHIYISGTPSVFINQRALHAWRYPEALRAVVTEEIKRAK